MSVRMNIGMDALSVMGKYSGIEEMQPWFQGDHMVFVMNGVPAMALTTAGLMQMELLSEITHTENDTSEIIDLVKLVANVVAITS